MNWLVLFAVVAWALVVARVWMLATSDRNRIYGFVNLTFVLVLAGYFTARSFGMPAPF